MEKFIRFIAFLSTIGISLGVMSLIVVSSVMNGFENNIEKNILGLIPHVILTTYDRPIDPNHLYRSVLDNIQDVTHIAPVTIGDIVLQSDKNIAVGFMLGVNNSDTEPLWDDLIHIRRADLTSGTYNVILGKTLAFQLGVQYGDKIRLIVPTMSKWTPVGWMPIQRLFTVVGVFASNNEVETYQVYVNQQDASNLMHYPTHYVTGWRLWLKNPLSVSHISRQSIPEGLVWNDWRARKGELFQTVHMEKIIMNVLFSLIIIVAIFNMFISLGLMVIEKRTEVAILMTQGLTRFQVIMIFILQGIKSGIYGTLLGIILGIILSSQLNNLIHVMNNEVSFPVYILPMQITVIALLSIIAAFCSTIYPSYRASTIHPAETLRNA